MQNKLYASIVTVFLLLGILFIDSSLNLRLVNGLQVLVSPIGIVLSDTGGSISGFFTGLGNIGKLQRENTELQRELDVVTVENATMKVAKEENEALKKELGFVRSSGFPLQSATVISFDPTLRSGINVRVDSVQGIKKGAPVMSGGYLVGRVAEVSGSVVKVSLIVDSTSAIPAVVLGKGITGIAKGIIGNGLIMDQVPQSEKIAENDLVVTSGLGGDLPKGIIIAKVGKISKISGSIFQGVELLPLVDFSKTERVMIGKQ